jgi:prepilin-type N-terminal cleavage/methylation domain-containing protein
MTRITNHESRITDKPLRDSRFAIRDSFAGFTLVEVLVALVVMVSAIAILAQGFTTGGGASVTAQNRTKAVWLAEEKMADLESGVLALNLGQSGTVTDNPDWKWEVRSDSTTVTGLYQMTVTIVWKERGQDRTYHLVRLMRERPSGTEQ